MLGRFEELYSNREAQMIKGEDSYCTKLLSLLWIIEFTMKGVQSTFNSLNPEYNAPYKGDKKNGW